MSVCQHRPEPGGMLVPCERREWIPDVGTQVHVCLCAVEVKDEQAERVARVPDSARGEESG